MRECPFHLAYFSSRANLQQSTNAIAVVRPPILQIMHVDKPYCRKSPQNKTVRTYRKISANALGPVFAAASSSLMNSNCDGVTLTLPSDTSSAERAVPLTGSLFPRGACRADLSGSSNAKIRDDTPVMRICGKTINKLCMPYMVISAIGARYEKGSGSGSE